MRRWCGPSARRVDVCRRTSPLLASPGRLGWRRAGMYGPATVAVASTCAASKASSTPTGGDVGVDTLPRFAGLKHARSLGLRKEPIDGREVGTGQPAVQRGAAGHLALDLAEHTDAAEPHA